MLSAAASTTITPPRHKVMRPALLDVSNQSKRCNEKMRVPSEHLRQLRHAMSQQTLRTRRIQHRPSQVDLLDNKEITSFGTMQLHIVEDYFPPSPERLEEPISGNDPSWMVLVHKKLRWRWRFRGLIHDKS